MEAGLLFAVGAAAAYGLADFSGALASRSAPAATVALRAQAVGALLAPFFLLLSPGELTAQALIAGAVAGVFGGAGLALYFHALSLQKMGAIAPINGVATAGVPLAIGVTIGERPELLAWGGIALSLIAIGLTTFEGASHAEAPQSRRALVFSVVAGISFGLFFAILAAAPDDAGAWPVLASKTGSLGVLGAWLALRKAPSGRPSWQLVLFSGITDVTANLLFLLATTVALVSITSVVVSSLYPLLIVLLAAGFARERLRWWQILGVILASAGIALISMA